MSKLLRNCLYSMILAVVFFAYLVRLAKTETLYALGLAVLSFGIFLMVNSVRIWKEERKRRALTMLGLIALFSLLIAPANLPLAINTFITFSAGVLVLIYREELLPNMPAFTYAWIGAVVGFIVAVLLFPHTRMGDAARAVGLIGLILAFSGLFLLIGRKVHYRPFNRYPMH
ncbi:hypothetical protein JCM16138_20650 [Thermococcus atlanticus]